MVHDFVLHVFSGVNGLLKKSVLIVYSPDRCIHSNSSHHEEVVRCFATYLRNLCWCDVRLDAFCDDQIREEKPLKWIYRQLDEAKVVIIINSVGAIRKCEALIQSKPCPDPQDLGHIGDLFTIAMENILQRLQGGVKKDGTSKYAVVTFDYTTCTCEPVRQHLIPSLSTGMNYQMMEHMEKLFFHIHGINKFEPGLERQVSGINGSDFHKCEEGRDLMIAIEKANGCYTKRGQETVHSYSRNGIVNNNNILIQRHHEDKVEEQETSPLLSDSHVSDLTLGHDVSIKAKHQVVISDSTDLETIHELDEIDIHQANPECCTSCVSRNDSGIDSGIEQFDNIVRIRSARLERQSNVDHQATMEAQNSVDSGTSVSSTPETIDSYHPAHRSSYPVELHTDLPNDVVCSQFPAYDEHIERIQSATLLEKSNIVYNTSSLNNVSDVSANCMVAMESGFQPPTLGSLSTLDYEDLELAIQLINKEYDDIK